MVKELRNASVNQHIELLWMFRLVYIDKFFGFDTKWKHQGERWAHNMASIKRGFSELL